MKKITTLLLAALLCGCGKPQSEFDALSAQLATEQTNNAALLARVRLLESHVKELLPLARQATQIPIKVWRREALTASSFVYHFENQSPAKLPIKIRFYNPTFDKARIFNVTLDATKPYAPASTSIGYAEGWAGAPGDTIEITSEGFSQLTITNFSN